MEEEDGGYCYTASRRSGETALKDMPVAVVILGGTHSLTGGGVLWRRGKSFMWSSLLRDGCQDLLHLLEVGGLDQMVIEPRRLRLILVGLLPVPGHGG